MKLVGAPKAEARADVNDKTLEILVGIQGVVGEIRQVTGRLEGGMARLPCETHQQDLRALEAKIDSVDSKVAEIREKDLPEIRASLSTLEWFKPLRNKIIAALLAALMAALLGGGGRAASDAALKALTGDAQAAMSGAGTDSPGKAPNSPFGAVSVPGAAVTPDVFVPGLDGQMSGPVPE